MNTFPLCANNYFVLLIVNVVILGLVSPGAKKTSGVALHILLKLSSGWHERALDLRWQ